MARLQILELPEGDGDDRPPFVLVIDQYEPPPYPGEPSDTSPFDGVAEQIGARSILIFEETIDIPANEVPIGPDGFPLKVRLEPDLTGWDGVMTTALANLHDAIGQQFTLKLDDRDIETTVKETLARQDPHSRA